MSGFTLIRELNRRNDPYGEYEPTYPFRKVKTVTGAMVCQVTSSKYEKNCGLVIFTERDRPIFNQWFRQRLKSSTNQSTSMMTWIGSLVNEVNAATGLVAIVVTRLSPAPRGHMDDDTVMINFEFDTALYFENEADAVAYRMDYLDGL